MSDKDQTTKTTHKKVIISIAAILAIMFVYQTGILTDAEALTRYYNSTPELLTRMVTLSLQNIENCYDQVFKGAKQAEKDEADAMKTASPLQ